MASLARDLVLVILSGAAVYLFINNSPAAIAVLAMVAVWAGATR